jgi:isoamylase
VSQDPVVSRAKLIAEPWDVGRADSYDLGRFPPLWSEWNGRYRDVMRDFWRSHDGLVGEFAARFSGSSDLYGTGGRRPTASVNFVTVHDGFTLADLVSYDRKHNEANGQANRDGADDNRSWNCGAEGPTTDPGILDPRARQRRAMLTTLLLSFGAPLLLGGRRARPHPAGQQQRLLPGQPDQLVRLVRARPPADRLHQEADRAAAGPPGVPAQPVPHRSGGR